MIVGGNSMTQLAQDSVEEIQMADISSHIVSYLSDETLLLALSHRDTWAMEPLYSRYNHLFYAVAYRIVLNRQIAEELLQDAFVAVWKNAHSYSAQAGSVRSWLLSILYHRAIDYVRSDRRHAAFQHIALEAIEYETYASSLDVWDEAWHAIQRTQLREAISKLSPEQRLVIELAYFQELSHAKIAEYCQVPLGTVKTRLRLAIMHLKNILEQMGMLE